MMTPAGAPPAAVLFDLDGTLLDTAPDMVAALHLLQAERAVAPSPFHLARNHVSNGAAGLLRVGFRDYDPVRHPDLHRRYLELYESRLAQETRLFPGLADLLTAMEARAIPWGVVTNKPHYLTAPLLTALELLDRAACVISGDTLPERKPHPRPILHALEKLAVKPATAVYVGDAARDIAAGRAAGTRTVAVRYGYIEPGADPATWGADSVVTTPTELRALLLGATP